MWYWGIMPRPKGKRGSGLRPKQRAFVREYLKDLNATQAAIRAGYSKRTARQTGAENMSKPAVKAAIEKAVEARAKRTQLDADFVLVKLGILASSNMLDYLKVDAESGKFTVDLANLTEQQAYAISEVLITEGSDGSQRLRFKLESKVAALRDLGRHVAVGAFEDRVKVTPGEELASYLDRIDGMESDNSRPGDREGGIG